MPAIRKRHDRRGGHADKRDETIGCTVGDSYLAARPDIIVNGFRSAGIVDCIGQL